MRGRDSRGVEHRGRAIALSGIVLVALTSAIAVPGCGGSSSDSDAQAVEARIARERADAAATARQAQKLADLQDEVDRLRRARRRAHTVVRTVAAATPQTTATADSPGRVFHAPSGNVSCQADARSASCTVAAIDTTFVLPASGGPAYVEHGAVLGRGSGDLADWGTSVSVGPVSCRIPDENEPSGITCVDTESGHGFEASRVASRQKAY
jgi:hypothetical protein